MALNKEQEAALNYVLQGHNLLVLGSAGTGKTYLVKKIVQKLKDNKKVVAVTATTGIACSLYESATTIHRWSGIGDGRHDLNEIASVVQSNASFAEVRKRILTTDVLVIDECSMLSKRMFDMLNKVCQIRQNDQLFGGIQLVLVGDFCQLAPVPNTLYGEDGDFCFKSELFPKVLPHRVTLTSVIRQTDSDLIKAIREVSLGDVSEESVSFIKGLNRPLQNDKDCVRLFSKNDQVDDFNRKCITEYPGELYEFRSNDEGEKNYLHKLLVPGTLWLKRGAPVILLRNLSDKLFNGLRGTIHDLTDNGPVVEFPSVHMTIPLDKMKFSVFSPSRNADVAARLQYPIKLSFAITIHKSQGLTLDSLEIDCRGIFKPGQLGVALGRARGPDGLRVVNFTAVSIIQQPAVVRSFLDGTSVPYVDNNSCCRKGQMSQEGDVLSKQHFTVDDILDIDSLTADATDFDEEVLTMPEEFDSEFDNIILSINEAQNESVSLPTDLNVDTFLGKLEFKDVKTPAQVNSNRILKDIDKDRYVQFCKTEFTKLSSFIEDLNIDPSVPLSAKSLSDFYGKVHMYQTSAEFRMNCLLLFENESFTEDHLHICFNVSVEIRKYLLKKKSELFTVGQRKISDRTLTNSSHARVRYVGGYCIAKVRHKYMQKKKSYMYKVQAADQAVYEESVVAVNILDGLKLEEQYVVATTKEPHSLCDISRRQNTQRSLTNISDELFHFFQRLTEICLSKLVDENLNKYGSCLFENIRSEILSQQDLREQFVEIASQSLQSNEYFDAGPVNDDIRDLQVANIYKKIIKLFLMVMVSQFRRDVLEGFNVQKKMAHRKQVRVSTSEKDVSKSVQMKKKGRKKEIRPITSADITEIIEGPSTSSGITESSEGPSTSRELGKNTRNRRKRKLTYRFLESDSSEEDQELKVNKSKGKSKLKKGSAAMPITSNTTEQFNQPSTSTGLLYASESTVSQDECLDPKKSLQMNVKETVRLSSSSDTGSDGEEKCKICNKGSEDTLWIQCDGCNGWLHRTCAGLKQNKKWKSATRKGAKFYCHDCK